MEICGAYTDPDVYAEVVIPGFVNAHAHLELSHMAGQIPERENGMTGFIRQLISKRFQMSEAERVRAMIEADELMFQDGIVAVGDISNGPESCSCESQKQNLLSHVCGALGCGWKQSGGNSVCKD